MSPASYQTAPPRDEFPVRRPSGAYINESELLALPPRFDSPAILQSAASAALQSKSQSFNSAAEIPPRDEFPVRRPSAAYVKAALKPPVFQSMRTVLPPYRLAALPSFESGKRDSNPRPQPWQGCALPTELFPPVYHAAYPQVLLLQRFIQSGGEGNRTPDLVNAIHALSQLSYAPVILDADKKSGGNTAS